ncbi:hypothetical protein [Microseira wollei]|uniref:Uncharacterized protein n=1 Tax=Microseira wollei NIES-4236 TaxID=2530354 RepID=A0AAV3X634_9CYAN|nr:hypothetical protein [Microseira wollei]GET36741.1 hypothetical protein MiSe_14930 [Microseira wollei NIES-4236]
MPTTAIEIYTQIVSTLSPNERLRLATLILNDLLQQNEPVIDQSGTWTQQDQLDVTTFSLQYATTLFPDSEEM